MDIRNTTIVVTGAASGLGWASARKVHGLGARVLLIDLPSSNVDERAVQLGDGALYATADITNESEVEHALDIAERLSPIRGLIHCAGRGGPVRILNRDGEAGSQQDFEEVVRVNLSGTFNMMRLAAARMARGPDSLAERGVCILTASIAAYEGQIGQSPYAASKAGIVGLTLVAARDLASRRIRVCSIAPGIFDTPMMGAVKEDVRTALAANVPHPSRFGIPEEFAGLAAHILENPMLNGETIRLDGALRMTPR